MSSMSARVSKPLSPSEKAEFERLAKRHIASLKPLEDRVKEWRPRQPDQWALKAPPVIDQATLEEAQTGRQLSPEQFEKACKDRRTLALQSEGIAARLKRAGVNVYQDSVAVLGLFSENFEEKTQYKNTNFIPEVQARNTHDMLKSVQYWLDVTDNQKTRMWVFSAGWVPLYEYREAHQKLTRWISKFSKHDLLKATQIEFVYYSIEGTIKKEAGQTYVNLHAHVLLKADRYLGKENWNILVENVRARAPKGYLHDSPIKKAAEVVKYCFKPGEFNLLNDDQLAFFYTATKGLRFYTPLGSLRDFRAQLKESKYKLKHIETDNGPQWRLIKSRERGRLEDIEEDKKDDDIGGSKGSLPNVICGITAPAPTFTEVYEPSLIIRNFDGNIDGLLSLNPWIEQRMTAIKKTVSRQQERLARFEEMKARARMQARFPSIRDTTTITVPETMFDEADEWQPPPDLSPEAGCAGWF